MKHFRILLVLVMVFAVSLPGCIVSKKDYLLKEEEAQKCSDNLARQTSENKDLRN